MNIGHFAAGRRWKLWLFTVFSVAVINVTTLTLTPTIGEDEVRIVDFGRVVLEPNTDWALTWELNEDRPLVWIGYLGPVIHELAFRLSGGSIVGPRLAALLGALLAATLCFACLRDQGLGLWAAWSLSVAWLTDPLVVLGYRHARVDVWAHAVCFAFLLVVNRFASSGSVWVLFAGGYLAATMLFVWPSSFLLLPLLAWGSWNAVHARGQVAGSAPRYRRLVGAMLLGAAAGTILLLLPVADRLFLMATGLHHMSGGALSYGGDFFSSLRLSPFLPLAAVAALVVARDRALWLASVLATGLVLLTSPYVHRVAYLIPTMIMAVAVVCRRTVGNGNALSAWLQPALAVVVAWSAFVSLGARSFVALTESALRDPNNAMVAARVLGRGKHRVLTETSQLYYAGRQLGWRMYGPVFFGDDAGREKLCRLVDFAVARSGPESLSFSRCGLSYLRTVHTESKGRVLDKLALLYGPYSFWERPPKRLDR